VKIALKNSVARLLSRTCYSHIFGRNSSSAQPQTSRVPIGPQPNAATDATLARSEHGVDQLWYLNAYPDVAAAGLDPVEHYLRFGWREGRDPRPDFSTLGYLALNDDVAAAGQNPLIHYLRNGGANGSGRLGGVTHWHFLWSKGLLFPKLGEEAPTTYRRYGTPGRPKILFVGHEATRTGAPLILLRLMEAIGRITGAELFLILERDGPLLEAYKRVAHVLVNRQRALDGLMQRRLLEEFASPAPDIAICNSAETWRLMGELRRAGIPHIVSLVHERMSRYGDEPALLLHGNADRIIFPARAVQQAAARAYPQYGDAHVVPQGLLKDGFGRGDKAAARRAVRDELELAADTKIVLGCGVREPRKGLDLFVQLAARLQSPTAVPVHFLWVGGDDSPTEFKHFVRHDIALLGLGASVSLVAETADPERYFLGADVYALTSRDDPFPCVVHEAMACALPVVAFDGAGGAGEALADGCGIIVPYLDLDAMEGHLRSVLARPADFAAMRENAERRVRSVYRFTNYARRILGICEELRASRGGSLAQPLGQSIVAN
jgi:glycosyltransferase involved in cell wall biosynthesis